MLVFLWLYFFLDYKKYVEYIICVDYYLVISFGIK